MLLCLGVSLTQAYKNAPVSRFGRSTLRRALEGRGVYSTWSRLTGGGVLDEGLGRQSGLIERLFE